MAFTTCRHSSPVTMRMAADFLDGIPKRLLPDLYYLGVFRGSSVLPASSPHQNSSSLMPPGGPGLVDFLE